MLYVHGQQLRSCRDGHLSYPHCSWASLSDAGNQYLGHILSPLTDTTALLESAEEENGSRNNFMAKSSRKDGPDAKIDRSASWFPSDIATDQTIAPAKKSLIELLLYILHSISICTVRFESEIVDNLKYIFSGNEAHFILCRVIRMYNKIGHSTVFCKIWDFICTSIRSAENSIRLAIARPIRFSAE